MITHSHFPYLARPPLAHNLPQHPLRPSGPDETVLVEVHNNHDQIAQKHGQHQHLLDFPVQVLGAEGGGDELGHQHDSGVVQPQDDQGQGVEGIGVEGLAEGFGYACAEHDTQVQIVCQHEGC